MNVSMLASATSGLKAAEARLDRAAFDTAFPKDRVSVSAGADVGPTVERISASLQFRANLKTIQAADQMTDDVLSLLAR